MALPSLSALDDWSSEIAEDAVGEMNGEISVIKPNTADDSDYDPEADSGGTAAPSTVLSHRRARIQHLKAPSDATGGGQWGTKTFIRFQVENKTDDPLILKGMIVVVHNGGKDKALEAFTYEVTRAVNSSHAALRTIEAVSELGPTS